MKIIIIFIALLVTSCAGTIETRNAEKAMQNTWVSNMSFDNIRFDWQPDIAAVREKWSKTRGFKRLGHRQVNAYSRYGLGRDKNFCIITMVKPGYPMTFDEAYTFMHEIGHCLVGLWVGH